MKEYRPTLKDLEDHGGCERLDRNGCDVRSVMQEVYKQTDGMSHSERTELVNRLYDRMNTEKTYREIKEYKERWGK